MTLKNPKQKGRKAEWEAARLLHRHFVEAGNVANDDLAFRPSMKEGITEDMGDIENSLGHGLVVQVKSMANVVNGLSSGMKSLPRQVAAATKWHGCKQYGIAMSRMNGGGFLVGFSEEVWDLVAIDGDVAMPVALLNTSNIKPMVFYGLPYIYRMNYVMPDWQALPLLSRAFPSPDREGWPE